MRVEASPSRKGFSSVASSGGNGIRPLSVRHLSYLSRNIQAVQNGKVWSFQGCYRRAVCGEERSNASCWITAYMRVGSRGFSTTASTPDSSIFDSSSACPPQPVKRIKGGLSHLLAMHNSLHFGSNFPPIHSGHSQIAYHHVYRLAAQFLQALLSLRGT